MVEDIRRETSKCPTMFSKFQRGYPGSLHCVLKTVIVRTIT